jgi:hypothetical protein
VVVTVYMCCHMPILNCLRCLNTLYMYDIYVGRSLKGSTASVTVMWDHFHIYIIYQLMSLTYRICFISLPIPVTGPKGPSKFIVLSWELAFYEISVASQNHVEVGHHQIAASGRDQ